VTTALNTVVIAIGSDHAGYRLKRRISDDLSDQGAVVLDFGTSSPDPVDYPLFCEPVAQAVARGAAAYGVVIDESGHGGLIVANKVPGVRATLCVDEASARIGRARFDANVAVLGALLVDDDEGLSIVNTFVRASFDGGAYARHVAQIAQVEKGVSFIPHVVA
jgi:ribose 5-phosphate isomerase B